MNAHPRFRVSDEIRQAHRVIDGALAMSKRPIMTTKFGAQSAVLLHMLVTRKPDIPVIWIDTGFSGLATEDFALELSEQLDLNLYTYRPAMPWKDVPPDIDSDDHGRFVERVKLEPFKRALDELRPDLWFSGIRREQTEFRESQQHFRTEQDQIWKVSPLLDWRDEDMEAYLSRHGLPVNLEYQDPTKGEIHRECGLHPRF